MIEIHPVTPVIGAEIRGVDLAAPLDDDTVAALRAALAAHLVVFFRDQPLTDEQHLALGRRFGELHIHPAAHLPETHPELLRIHADASSRRVAGEEWHSDVSCDPEPPMGSILRLHTVPPYGGDTLFANMYAAFETLSAPIQDLLCGLQAVHSGRHVYERPGYRDDRRYPESTHPVVRTHPETGRRALFVNRGFTTRIVGLRRHESDALLAMLFRHVETPELSCRFRWSRDAVAFWDNRCTQHHALFDYHPAVRSGWRVTIAGDKPYLDLDRG